MQPLRRFELDAAILFSDIMTPLQGMGVALDFAPGPVVREPIRTLAQIEALPALVPERDVPFVMEIRAARARQRAARRAAHRLCGRAVHAALLSGLRPALEGIRRGARVPVSRAARPPKRLLTKLADAMAAYLRAQAQAGAQALMLFESWAGLLAPAEFRRFALRAVARTVRALRTLGVPLIYYANQGARAARRHRRAGCGCRRHRLAHAARASRAARSGRAKPCRAISIPPRCLRRPRSCKRHARRRARGSGRRARPHLQSRPRHLAGNRSRCRRAARRLRARVQRARR